MLHVNKLHQHAVMQVLTLHLLHEASKGPASFWCPYIQQLPRRYTTFLAWHTAAVLELQLVHAQQAAAAAIAKGRAQWTRARPVLKALGRWCGLLFASTRGFMHGAHNI